MLGLREEKLENEQCRSVDQTAHKSRRRVLTPRRIVHEAFQLSADLIQICTAVA